MAPQITDRLKGVKATSGYEGFRDMKPLAQDLVATGSVFKTANAKAYEMMSDLVGAVELYKVTGDESLLAPVLAAWHDIRDHRLYRADP